MRTVLFVFASVLCAAAQAGTQAPREDASKPQAREVQVDANWATPPAPAARAAGGATRRKDPAQE
ncbi:hypothetical protein [Janthinobacterium sp. 61]|uniref:hypothetical protein n=1 Tax=Janthinobacterium sp. 61 TaxID=2035209 RepID=UPI000C70541A|nr:hypothetical protein [Janthinobacterium sp. 61]